MATYYMESNDSITSQCEHNSPTRKVLGDIKNVSDGPQSPVSPTANLKLLTRVASQFRRRDFGEGCIDDCHAPTDTNSLGKIQHPGNENCNATDIEGTKKDCTRQVKRKGCAGLKPRKDKSLSLLCDKFLELFPLELAPGAKIHISLDRAASLLCTERRRLYDIINVLESLRMASKIGKNCYQWIGSEKLHETLAILKGLAEKLGYQKKVKVMQKLCHCSARAHVAEGPVLQQGDAGRDERSLGVLCQKFLMLFLVCSETDLVNLDLAARFVLGGPESDALGSETEDVELLCKGIGNNLQKAKARRLYDIANVLTSLRLIRKVPSSDSLRKPAFAYCGPIVEPIMSTEDVVDHPYNPTRHSLLRPPYFNRVALENEKQSSGTRLHTLKRTYSDSVLLSGHEHPSHELNMEEKRKVTIRSPDEVIVALLPDCGVNYCVSVHDNSFIGKQNVESYQQAEKIEMHLGINMKNQSSADTSISNNNVLNNTVMTESDIGQFGNIQQPKMEVSATKFIRHNSEPCVGKSSISVQRKLVKVSPFNTFNSRSFHPNSDVNTAMDNNVQKELSDKSTVNGDSCLIEDSFQNFDNMSVASFTVVPQTYVQNLAPNRQFTVNSENNVHRVNRVNSVTYVPDMASLSENLSHSTKRLLYAPVIPGIISTTNKPRIILTEEMIKKGTKLTNYSVPDTAKGRPLLPKTLNSNKLNIPQSHLSVQPNAVDLQSTVASSNMQCSENVNLRVTDKVKHKHFLASDDSKSDVTNINGGEEQAFSASISELLQAPSVFNQLPNEKSSGDKQDNVITKEMGKSSLLCDLGPEDQQLSRTHVSDEHCYNKLILQETCCASSRSGLVSQSERIVLPDVVPGRLYTAVKVGSVLQLVPVNSSSLQNLKL